MRNCPRTAQVQLFIDSARFERISPPAGMGSTHPLVMSTTDRRPCLWRSIPRRIACDVDRRPPDAQNQAHRAVRTESWTPDTRLVPLDPSRARPTGVQPVASA